MILREKDFGRDKFILKDNRKECHVLVKKLKVFDLKFFIKEFRMTLEKLGSHLAMVG